MAAYFETSAQAGSPPRGRGKVVEICDVVALVGITPAWAGKRGVEKTPCLWYTDHPRAGGEKSEEIPAGSTCEGSPPRRRGKVVGKEILPRRVGITPAWAGKSITLQRIKKPPGDHPRVGGEKKVPPW